jgi:hypothetical protein
MLLIPWLFEHDDILGRHSWDRSGCQRLWVESDCGITTSGEVAVGTPVAQRPPRGSVRALISAHGSYRGYLASKRTMG